MNFKEDKSIVPIQTRYKGYNFRSRLEARWAVYFDTLGIKWEYEVEGYDVNGRWYLPDFWLPDFEVFVEIKPTKEFDKDLYHSFPRASNKSIILFEGNPWDCVGWWFGFIGSSGCSDDNLKALRRCHFLPTHKSGAVFHQLIVESLEHDVRHCNGRHWWEPCGEYAGTYDFLDNHTIIGSGMIRKSNSERSMSWEEIDNLLKSDNSILSSMKDAAKSARFEHGESGAT
jgi:hypothetical protein